MIFYRLSINYVVENTNNTIIQILPSLIEHTFVIRLELSFISLFILIATLDLFIEAGFKFFILYFNHSNIEYFYPLFIKTFM